MKRIILLMLVFTSLFAKAQVANKIDTARNYVNAQITPNHSQLITATKMNNALNKIIDAITQVDSLRNCKVDSIYTKVGINDSLFFRVCGNEKSVSIFTAPVLVDSAAYVSMTQLDSVTVIFCDRTGRCDTLVGIMGEGGGGSQNLQQVTDVGPTTTNSMQVNGDNKFIGVGSLVAFGSAFLTQNETAGGNLSLSRPSGSTANLGVDSLTGNRSYQFPNASGTLALRSDITGGASTDKLNDVASRDSALNHTMLAISKNSDTTAIRDSIVFKVNQSWNTANNGLSGKTTHVYQDEKYGTNDPAGKPYGRIYNHLWTNNYNGVGARRGFGQIIMGYNMTKGQGRENNSEAAFGVTLETDYQRSFEWYTQVETTTGLSYRPIMIRPYKDTTFCSITYKGNYCQWQLPDSSAEYFNIQNGQMTLFNIPNRTAPSSTNTIFNLTKGSKTVAISNNSADMLFTGATNAYTFDNNVRPSANNTYDLGGSSVRFKTSFSNAIVNSYVIPSDANYTQLATDHTINFKNITAGRTCTLIAGVAAGQKLELISGQNSFAVTLAGTWPVKNIDGTTATSLPAGKSCILVWDNTTFYWQVVSISSGAL